MYNPITTQINTTGIVIAALISVKNRVDSGCSGLRGLGIGFALFSTKGFLKFGFGPTGPLRGGGSAGPSGGGGIDKLLATLIV